MKHHIKLSVALAGLLAVHAFTVTSQTVSTFDDVLSTPDTFWDGSDKPMGTLFNSGNAIFYNYFDTYWSSGWAYSSMRDSVTPGYGNLYSARPGTGAEGSVAFGVATPGYGIMSRAIIMLNEFAFGKPIKGFFVTNTTYAARSMEQGDQFAKKFGGISGDDPDWFKLTIRKYLNASSGSDDILEFYLADFRFTDNAMDYIVTDWRWVDLTSMGKIDSLSFTLSSSDNGLSGMNTPAYFCIDNFTTADSVVSAKGFSAEVEIFTLYPNPTGDILNIELKSNVPDEKVINIYNLLGEIIYSENISSQGFVRKSISLKNYPDGIYYFECITGQVNYKKVFAKGD